MYNVQFRGILERESSNWGANAVHLKDLEAAVMDATKASRKCLTVLERVLETIHEVDQQVTLCKQLEEAGELQNILEEAKLVPIKAK